mmetsp:Transcript_2199/g.3108  ORF Transcript_2199/g.3108 Transcript_2199/m.3108 type:complete len:121 (-) Transcript_2199:101-463(-)
MYCKQMNNLNACEKLAKRFFPPVDVCQGQSASRSREVEYLVRVWQDYLDTTLRDLVNIAKHRGGGELLQNDNNKNSNSNTESDVIICRNDLVTLGLLSGQPLVNGFADDAFILDPNKYGN